MRKKEGLQSPPAEQFRDDLPLRDSGLKVCGPAPALALGRISTDPQPHRDKKWGWILTLMGSDRGEVGERDSAAQELGVGF